jgi:non-homologous end joining protein Ku
MAAHIALEFAGMPVNVQLSNRVKKTRNESFKTIAPSGAPAHNGDPVDEMTGKTFNKDLARKGVPVPGQKGAYAVLSADDVETITKGVKTEFAEHAQFAQVDTIAFDLAIDRYSVIPDPKVPGAEVAANILWNGLRESRLAHISQVSLSGGMDQLLVVYADDQGLWAAGLPFEEELYAYPTFEFSVDEKAAKLASKKMQKEAVPFNHSAFKSEYKARRKAVIDAVLAGTPVEIEQPKAKAATPDLMAMLEAEAEEVEA